MGSSVELFHGPGGWAEGMKLLGGLPSLGVDVDRAAVLTARAAGHHVIRADVRSVDWRRFVGWGGFVGSPPCPGFSAAGLGLGRQDLPRLLELVGGWSAGPVPVDGWKDERSALTLEVVRWLAALEPEWVALEQVKEVLPVWQAIGEQLRARGYSVWTGLVYAERYGVPQTRTRAILIASRSRVVGEPVATHQRYYPPGHKLREMPSLEEQVLPRWVSMAEALGWAATDLVGFPRLADTPSNKTAGVVELDGERYRERDLRPADLPAFNLTEKARSWQRWQLRANGQANASSVRDLGEPAPTIKGGHDFAERVWEPVGYERRQQSKDGVPAPVRPVDEPAPTIAGESRNDSWVVRTGQNSMVKRDPYESVPFERTVSAPSPTITGQTRAWTVDRPSTTVQGDPRVWPPGHKVNADDIARGHEHYGDRAGSKAIRVSIEEAAVLQSFRPDYPWHGTKTKQFQQVGNAVPPLLAAAILREVLGV